MGCAVLVLLVCASLAGGYWYVRRWAASSVDFVEPLPPPPPSERVDSPTPVREPLPREAGQAGFESGEMADPNAGEPSPALEQMADEEQVASDEVPGSILEQMDQMLPGAGLSDDVSRTIRGQLPAIQRCYERQLANDPTLHGTVRVEFAIQEGGGVSNARAASNDSGSDALATCVVDIVNALSFYPGPVGGSVVYMYPFVFAPNA